MPVDFPHHLEAGADYFLVHVSPHALHDLLAYVYVLLLVMFMGFSLCEEFLGQLDYRLVVLPKEFGGTPGERLGRGLPDFRGRRYLLRNVQELLRALVEQDGLE